MIRKVFIALVSATLVAGCASSVSSFKDVQAEGQKRVSDAKEFAIKDSKLPHIRYSDDFYVPELKERDQDKPQWFVEPTEGSYLDYTLEEVMRDVLARRGVNIRYLDGLEPNRKFSLVHKGTIGELLDKISFATKYSYQLDGDLLTWSKFKTAEFDISFIAGKTEYLFGSKENSQGNSNANSGGGAVNTVVTDTGFSTSDEYINFSTKDLSIWDDLKKSLELLKSGEGKFVINQATSTVMIKDYPDNVAAIAKYLRGENSKLTQMVAVDLQIIEYTSEEGDQRGINWNVIKQDLASGGVFGLQTSFNNLIQDDLAPTILGYSKTTGKYAGSKVLINVLDKYGVVSNVSNKRIVSLNNQVSKIVKGGETGYLASSGGTATANVGSQDNLVPGILKTGTAIFMLPNAVDDQVIIQLSSKITRLENLRTVESGEKAIETPETANSDLFLKFAVKDGQTLLISGSSDDRHEYEENSTAGLLLLGGELGGKKSTKETIMLLTPRIIRN
ncbi:hypothetical protein G3489_19680 [Shewanella baltica]|uniref:hypothetical protein n=1 Tax=Shewanella baltica TaxID=62322 RepID=UPI00217E4401|nr:hypothetical protein [Shewanella baltica]MCS6271899.1 hypothetical protein [Shewanella baltica]